MMDEEAEERRAIVVREALILSVNIEAAFPILTNVQTQESSTRTSHMPMIIFLWNNRDKAFLTLRVDFDVHRLYLAGCENPDTTVVVSFSLDLVVSICSRRNLYCEGNICAHVNVFFMGHQVKRPRGSWGRDVGRFISGIG